MGNVGNRNDDSDRSHFIAAHCIHPKYSEMPHDYKDIAAVLGHHNFAAHHEEGSVTRLLSKIKIHPDWDSAEIKYDADLAILVMIREVEFSSFIQPVCITVDHKILQHDDGYVVIIKRFDSKICVFIFY